MVFNLTLAQARRMAGMSNPVAMAERHGAALEAALAMIRSAGTGNRGRDAAACAALRSAIAIRDHRDGVAS